MEHSVRGTTPPAELPPLRGAPRAPAQLAPPRTSPRGGDPLRISPPHHSPMHVLESPVPGLDPAVGAPVTVHAHAESPVPRPGLPPTPPHLQPILPLPTILPIREDDSNDGHRQPSPGQTTNVGNRSFDPSQLAKLMNMVGIRQHQAAQVGSVAQVARNHHMQCLEDCHSVRQVETAIIGAHLDPTVLTHFAAESFFVALSYERAVSEGVKKGRGIFTPGASGSQVDGVDLDSAMSSPLAPFNASLGSNFAPVGISAHTAVSCMQHGSHSGHLQAQPDEDHPRQGATEIEIQVPTSFPAAPSADTSAPKDPISIRRPTVSIARDAIPGEGGVTGRTIESMLKEFHMKYHFDHVPDEELPNLLTHRSTEELNLMLLELLTAARRLALLEAFAQPRVKLGKTTSFGSPLLFMEHVPSMGNLPAPRFVRNLEEGEDDAGFPTINNYTIIGEAGKGSYGSVKIALTPTGDQRAIKIMPRGRLRKKWADALRKARPRQGSSVVGGESVSGGLQQNSTDRLHQSPQKTSGKKPSPPSTGSTNSPNPSPRSSHHGSVDDGSTTPPTAPASAPPTEDIDVGKIHHEIAVMKKIRHQNIVPLLEVIDDSNEDLLYLVMPYIERGPLLRLTPQGTCTPLDIDITRGCLRQLLDAMQYLHERHIVHRDIKPDNILLGNDGKVYLSDFGVSQMFREGEEEVVDAYGGTPAFMAPECFSVKCHEAIAGKPVDVWALGVTLYLMLLGHLPFEGSTADDIERSVKNEEFQLPELTTFPEETRREYEQAFDLIRGMLVKDPKSRFTVRQCRFHPFVSNIKRVHRDRFLNALLGTEQGHEQEHSSAHLGSSLSVKEASKSQNQLPPERHSTLPPDSLLEHIKGDHESHTGSGHLSDQLGRSAMMNVEVTQEEAALAVTQRVYRAPDQVSPQFQIRRTSTAVSLGTSSSPAKA